MMMGYGNKLLQIRGEFELQQRSLQALLQSKDDADRLWQQTIDLAVKSPFRIKELVSYTKQLAAYQIESEKLFETNKMLADVSAGLSVDMQRLILAFGQVKAANFLRGTELRQFTEAGIPMLEELAKYFTELEGRAVSVSDVFERISKRMVSFADVEEVFKRITSEGGTFYRMQEIQAETLRGQISNLKDAVDIMLNDIGKAHQDTLKSSVAFVRSIVQNWRLLATAIQQAGFALAGFSAVTIIRALRLTGDALEEAAVKTKGLTAATAKLKLAMKDLGKWVKANPYLLAAGLVASAAHALVQYGKSVDAMNEKYDEMSQRELRRVDTLKQLNEQVEKNNQAIKDAIAEQDNASEGTDEYATAEENLSRARGKNISLLERLKKEYPEVYASITKQEDGTVDLTKAIEEQNKVAQRQIALQQQAKGGWFQESLTKNYEDAVEALGDYQSSLDKVAVATYEMRQNLLMALSSGQITQEEYDAISSIADRMMDIKDSVEGLNLIEEIFGTKAMSNAEISALVEPIRHALVELGETVPEYSWALGDFFDNLENLKSLPVTINEMVALDPEKGKENAGDYVESVLDEFGIVNDTIREWAKRKIEKIIGFKLVWGNDEGGGGDDELDDWAKRVKEAIDALNEEIKKKSPEIDADALFPVPNKKQTKEEYLAVAKDAIGVAEMTYDELQKIEDQKVVDRTKALSPFVETFRKILNLSKETTPRGGDKDTFTPMLRTVKEIYQEFKKLQGSFDDLTAKEGALAKFGDAFKEAFGKTPEQMGFDLFSEEGVKAAYDYLISKAPDAKKKIQAQLAKGEIVWDVKLQTKKDADKELLDDIQELFDRYDLSLELKKLNIPPDLAKALFGIESINLSDIREKVQGELDSTKAAGGQEDRVKQLEKDLEKINDMEDKAQIERLKTYLKYTRAAIGERAKIKVEEMTKLQEIEETFNKAIAKAKTKEDKKRIEEQRKLAISGVQREASQSLSKIDWEEFRKSETFISLFDDLGGASDAILTKVIEDLDKFKEEWKDLPLDQMKEVIELRNKAQRAMESNDSPWGEAKRLRGLIEDDGRTREEAELDSYNAEQEKARFERELEMIGLINQKRAEGVSDDQLKIVLGEKYGYLLGEIVDLVTREVDLTNKLIPAQDSIIDKSQERIQNEKDLIEAYKKQEDTLREVQNMANDLYDSFKELSEALGGDSESPAAVFADMGMSMANSVLNAIMLSAQLKTIETGAMAAGTALNTAMGVIGWIVMGVQLLTAGIKAIVKINDNQIVSQLEDQAAIIERQRDLYEQIEEKVDKAYSVEQLRQYNDEMKRSVDLEIQALEASIALERSRKNADEDQIADWQKEIDEARKRLEESTQEMKEMVGGIFDLEDFTSGFIDAWWDAMEEGMDGLDALNDHFEDTMKDLIKKQALYKGAQKIMEQVMNAINADLEGDYDIDDWSEIERIAKKANIDLDAFLQGYKEIFNSISNGDAGGLSSLQKGIQGVSEQTAQVIEAYLNSVRMYVATISADTTSQLNEVKAIHRLLDSVTLGGHSRGGVGFKVFMD